MRPRRSRPEIDTGIKANSAKGAKFMAGYDFKLDDLRAALADGVLDQAAFDRLETYLASRAKTAHADARERRPRFDFVHVLWYLGALIVLGAMGLFSTTAFGLWGAPSLLLTAIVYAVLFTAAGAYLWRRGLRTPGGLLVACAVGMAPLFIFAVQSLTGNEPGTTENYHDFYVWVRSSWLPMEITTIVFGLLALAFFPFPFLVMIISFALWFLSMDLTPWLAATDHFTWEQRANVSLWFGLAMLAVAWTVDLKRWRDGDFAFWLHLFGLMTFWGGLTAQHSDFEFGKAVYNLVNLGLIVLGVFLMRRAYLVFGGVGVTLYIGHLAAEVFKDSILFPFVLSGIGVLVIGAGLLFHKYGGRLQKLFLRASPAALTRLRPAHAREGAEV
jgi:hypothetical protein